MNSIHVTGHLTRDPELREFGNGKCVCRLSLAVDRMGRGGEVGYIDVAEFGRHAQATASTVTEGWLVAVEGRLELNHWETKAGERRSTHSIVGHVEHLSPPDEHGDGGAAQPVRT